MNRRQFVKAVTGGLAALAGSAEAKLSTEAPATTRFVGYTTEAGYAAPKNIPSPSRDFRNLIGSIQVNWPALAQKLSEQNPAANDRLTALHNNTAVQFTQDKGTTAVAFEEFEGTLIVTDKAVGFVLPVGTHVSHTDSDHPAREETTYGMVRAMAAFARASGLATGKELTLQGTPQEKAFLKTGAANYGLKLQP